MARLMLLLAISGILITTSAAFRILTIPCSHKGHINMFSIMARAFKDSGHDVDVLVMESRRSLVDSKGVTAVPYNTVPEARSLETNEFLEKTIMSDLTSAFDLFSEITRLSTILIEGILQDTNLMEKLEKAHYDLVIVDGIDFARALYIIPYTLGIKYMTVTARYNPWGAGVPALPSVDHLAGISSPITENSTIFEKIQNILKSVMVYRNMPPPILQDSIIARYAPTRPKATFDDLFRASEMWITNLDTVCLDWPRLHSNHFQFVLGLSLEPPKPLPEDLEAFVQGSKVGVIIVTFGSALMNIPVEMLEKMLPVFAQIEHRVLIRHSGQIDGKVPANVKMMSWIPQSDLLAHPKTKIFITHGGGNGQLEAVYNSVPMITIPMFGDQFYNADRAKLRGFAITLNKQTFTSDDLLRAIKFFSKDKQTKERIRQCSAKLRRMPNAHDTVVFWAEHVIQFGGDHLKPVSFRVPLWKAFMLDILALFMIIVLIIYTLLLFVAYKLYRKFFSAGKDVRIKSLCRLQLSFMAIFM
ncbi:hypothetical protein LSH36_63g06043 [Paralvinella palmiformis]|uniref:Glucuronosyltransferase n=1 Tax=Paralvinella palmiformis TaxID=53620 RepID=A0AAD9K4A5_9ANNE|nr:hypothetical protein LSH36_63g06043 [Paralvinella palmiformis]